MHFSGLQQYIGLLRGVRQSIQWKNCGVAIRYRLSLSSRRVSGHPVDVRTYIRDGDRNTPFLLLTERLPLQYNHTDPVLLSYLSDSGIEFDLFIRSWQDY